ncbi:hypothetical protein [Solirubrobacter soli]|uniref:hypothetical protein n=1 Tax=Solirubrobacter soli TaxID=363832 RepID=UPI0003FAC3FB|nr:hypothetical protein [Solirubrobacter soli]
MRWLVVLAACGVLAGCGGSEYVEEAAPTRAPTLHFVKLPLVLTSKGNGVSVWFRLNRPLGDNEGALGEHPDYAASIEIDGTTPDIPLLYRDDLHPTCYGQFLDGDVTIGQDVNVGLRLGPDERIVATATVQEETGASGDAQAVRRLRCPSDHGATRRCKGVVDGRYIFGIDVRSATNTSCRTARAVMRSAGRWADSRRCYETLCAGKHRMNRGYRCDAELVGEAAWQITCTRGDKIVRGFTAD